MQDKWGLFQKFLITEESQVSIQDFIINALVLIVLTFILERTYAKCARSLSNRKMFASNFLLMAFTTMLIITIVKSSLALSLGLVGALSIVRFRAAIKEPEELVYLFFAIAIGVGLGASQTILVIVAFIFAQIILWSRYLLTKKSESQNLFFTVYSDSPSKVQLKDIQDLVRKNFNAFELKRYDENNELIEASFLVETIKVEDLQSCKNDLQKLSDSVKVTFIDNKNY